MGRFSKNYRKRGTRKYKGGYSDASSFMMERVGTLQQQLDNMDSNNNLKILNGGRRKRGGNIGAVLYQAIPPVVLLGAQQKYKKGKSFPTRKNHSFTKSNNSRRNRRR